MERVREPLIHITRREGMPVWKGLLIRAAAVIAALLICAAFISAASPDGDGYFRFFESLVSGNFGGKEGRKLWLTLQSTALLLCVALALVVAFRMKFWNLGGNGQVLAGCLACAMCMQYLGGTLSGAALWIVMLVCSVAAGAVWALIPALFKAFFNTNESLFTLMMNYIAMYLVAFFVNSLGTNTGTMPPLPEAALPPLGDGQMGKSLLTILIAVLVTALIFCYLRFSKHGYEIAVVGESQNTARYAGINVKKVIIRTLILSGAICGLTGFLLTGSINQMVSTTMDDNMGFTGIMVAWMGKFNPLIMAAISLLIVFLSRGMEQVCSDFGFTSEALSDIVVGLIYFFFIGCEFFLTYRIHINRRKRQAPAFSMDASSADDGEHAQDARERNAEVGASPEERAERPSPGQAAERSSSAEGEEPPSPEQAAEERAGRQNVPAPEIHTREAD